MREMPIGEVDGRTITFSAGVSRWRGEDVEETLLLADQALYDAKRGGRDRICRSGHTGAEA
ncbi:GGDEF domain-containing protein [Novosphingobium sp. KA1]|nr:GGDEF domain-containing protein [Novosphingobium sp. KA1]